jgi:hypothetical protein
VCVFAAIGSERIDRELITLPTGESGRTNVPGEGTLNLAERRSASLEWFGTPFALDVRSITDRYRHNVSTRTPTSDLTGVNSI